MPAVMMFTPPWSSARCKFWPRCTKIENCPGRSRSEPLLQPSEELATGARHMIHHHAIRDIDAILALHVDPTRRVGCIGLRNDMLTAACDCIHVNFSGKGGHGARPQITNDPIDACTHWVQSAFRRIGRTADPHETVVFSVGQIEAGHSANVIPDTASLAGSLAVTRPGKPTCRPGNARGRLRGDSDEKRDAKSKCIWDSLPPRSSMTTESSQLLADSVTQALNAGAIEWIDQPSMGSEDFSYYLEHIPGAMFRLGVAGDQVGHAPLHTSTFDIDERALAIGAKLFATAVINYFDPRQARHRRRYFRRIETNECRHDRLLGETLMAKLQFHSNPSHTIGVELELGIVDAELDAIGQRL